MKNQEFSSLTLTSDYYKILIAEIFEAFKTRHNLKKLPKAMQLFGYGNYDETKPSLKKDLEYIENNAINGKYLYDKTRDFEKGKPVIRINNYYKTLILVYLGYDDIQQFLDKHKLSKEKEKLQHNLIYDDTSQKTYYFINYYYGEDDVLIKGETVITNNWKKIKHTYVYPQDDGSVEKHYNFGNITRREDTLHISSKTLLDGKLVEGSSEIYYIGHNNPTNMNYLIGTYCTFDIYTNTVAGRSILEKCTSKEEMEEKSNSPIIPDYIAMEVRNKRIVNDNIVAKHFLELSSKSPYASLYGKLPGTYTLTFNLHDGFKEQLQFKILPNNYKLVTTTKNVYVEKDRIELLNKGSVLNFRFSFTGIIALERVNIYVKTYFLRDDSTSQKGVFSGIDNENRLVNGEVLVAFTPVV